jgi:hypothetical protein
MDDDNDLDSDHDFIDGDGKGLWKLGTNQLASHESESAL